MRPERLASPARVVAFFAFGAACRAVEAVGAVTRRGSYLAGRAVGMVDQIRDVVSVATLPRTFPTFPWSASLRIAYLGLRGYDLRPFLKMRAVDASIRREVAARAAREGFGN